MDDLPKLQCFVKNVAINANGKITGKTLWAQTVMPSKNAFVYFAGCFARQINTTKSSSVTVVFVKVFFILLRYFGR